MNNNLDAIEKLKQGLVVSAQAAGDEPLNKPEHLLALSLSALNGGASGLRLEGIENIRYIKARVKVPVIGLLKSGEVEDSQRLQKVYITASFSDAELIAEAGADIIAIDATSRERPDGLSLSDLIGKIHSELQKPVWADVSSIDEGMNAARCGADLVSTTLYGYTEDSKRYEEDPPDFELLGALCKNLKVPVALEGRVWHPEELRRAFELGAFTVVVGSAITRPQLITRRFVRAIPFERAAGG